MFKKKFLAMASAAILAVISILTCIHPGVSADTTSANNFADTENWAGGIGTVSQTESGLTLSGEGKAAGNFINKYYDGTVASLEGFHMTANLTDLVPTDSRFGFYFTKNQSANHVFDGDSQGIFVFFQPFAANDKITAFHVNIGYNTGSGFGVVETGKDYYFGLAFDGAVDMKLVKDSGGAWHIILNGTDAAFGLPTDINALLSAGNLHFGVEATMNNASESAQKYTLVLKQINGQGMGTRQIVDDTNFVKSIKSNVSSDQKLEVKPDGVYLSGSLPQENYLNLKYGYNKTIKGSFDGFTTSFEYTADSLFVSGQTEPSINFAITTTGDGTINSDRLDVWDYFGSKVPAARGVQIKFKETSKGLYETNIFILGDGELNAPGDFFNGNTVTVDAKGRVVISIVEDNDKNHWYLLANGQKLLPAGDAGLQAAFDAEINTLNSVGGCAVFSAGYDKATDLTNPKAQVIVSQINGVEIGAEIISETIDKGNTITGTKKLSMNNFQLSDLNKDNASYTMTDNGLKVSAMNGPSGFNGIISYKDKISTDSIGVTLKLDKVYESTPGFDHHVDVLFSSKPIANFADAKCLYIRMNTKGNDPSDGLSVTVVINTADNQTGITNGIERFDVPVGDDNKVTIKFVQYNGHYLLFINAVKIPLSSIDDKITTLFNETLGGQAYFTTSTGFDSVDDQEEPTIYYVEAFNGEKWTPAASTENPTEKPTETSGTTKGEGQKPTDSSKSPETSGQSSAVAAAILLLLSIGACSLAVRKKTM